MENRSDIRASVTGLRDTVAESTALLNELNQTFDKNSTNIDDLLNNIRMTHREPPDSDRDPEVLSRKPDSRRAGDGPQTWRDSEIGDGAAEDKIMRFMISTCLVIGGLGCASCVATRPVRYYPIQPLSPPANQGKPDGLVLLVGDITTPEALQECRIRYRN